MTKAEELRRRGNSFFYKSKDPSTSPVLRKGRLQDALRLYNDAFSESQNDDERASCKKNCGIVSFQQAVFILKDREIFRKEQASMVNHHFKESVSNFFAAESFGQRVKGQEWLDILESTLEKNIDETILLLRELELPWRKHCLQGFCMAFRKCALSGRFRSAAVKIHLHCGEYFFHQGIQKLEASDCQESETIRQDSYKQCLNSMHECYTPLTCAEDLARGKPEFLSRIADLQEQVCRYLCTCEALQAIASGNQLLLLATEENEGIDIDGVWASFDKFKEATLLTRGKDLETEAVALSCLGGICARVLHMAELAHRYYSQAVQVGLTLIPIVPRIATSKWYKEALTEVGEYQRRKREEEEVEKAKEREPILLLLKEELTQLKLEAMKSAESLLKFAYKTHPPKDKRHQMSELGSPSVTKKALVQAILHYHPDKNRGHGRKWEVLCEEITKQLNIKYEYFKG